MTEPRARSANRGEVIVSAVVLALGIAYAIGTWRLPDAPGYAQVGPRLFPALISGGLIVVGALLLKQALTSGFPALPDEPRANFDWPAFLWVSGGVIAHMILIAGIGFILASTLLFVCVARAFGSPRPLRDLGLGLVLNSIVYVIFTQALTLSLLWGAWLPQAAG